MESLIRLKLIKILLNVVCNIREKLDESFEEEDKSLVIDIDEIVAKVCKELE